MTLKRGNRTKSKVTRKQLKGGRRSRSSGSRSSRSRSRGSSGSSGSRSQTSDRYVQMAIRAAIRAAEREAINDAEREAPTTSRENISRLRRIYNDLLEQDNNHASEDSMDESCRYNRAEVLQLKRNILSHGTQQEKRQLRIILQDLKYLCPPDTIFQRANRERERF